MLLLQTVSLAYSSPDGSSLVTVKIFKFKSAHWMFLFSGALRLLQIEKHVAERNVGNESSYGIWDSDDFQWMEECRRVLREIFKLSDFRALQRFLFIKISRFLL